jgi:hypothetical protein
MEDVIYHLILPTIYILHLFLPLQPTLQTKQNVLLSS